MAKKRGGGGGGGGSNMALILFLVLFILSTVVLGVTTYMGYDALEEARKKAADAEASKKKVDSLANWYRFQANTYREFMGQPPVGKDEDRLLLAQIFSRFDKGPSSPDEGKDQKDEPEVRALVKKLKETMPWDPAPDAQGKPKDLAPVTNYERRLQEKERQIQSLIARAKKAEDLVAAKEKEIVKLNGDLKAAQDDFDAGLAKEKEKTIALGEQYKKDLQGIRDDLTKANEDKNKEKVKADELAKANRSIGVILNKERAKVTQATKSEKEVREERDRVRDELKVYQEKHGTDTQALSAAVMDEKANELLKNWKKNWQIVMLDRTGKSVYIDLGSADGLKPQVTFSVHARGSGGKLSMTPKGTVEVKRIIGPHLALAQVTSTRDARSDPILKGDRLFNPTWDPSRRKHVAIAGLVDMGGEGLDSSEDFRRLLARQNVAVDAYIDTKAKTPQLKGGITTKTDYLVLGDSLEAVKHDKARDNDFVKDYNKMVNDLKEKARSSGVVIISLRRYLDMIGYQPPRVTSTSSR